MIKYIVQSGDNLQNIALKFNISMQDIVRLNKIKDPDMICPGEKLLIPVYSIPYYPYPVQIKPCPYWLIPDSLFICISTDKTFYRMGERLKTTLLKTNMGRQDIALTYNTSQQYDFLIKHISGKTLWKWSEDKCFTQSIGKIIIEPDKTIRYCEVFSIPKSIEKGIYTVIGWNTSRESKKFKLCLPIVII
ncbi:MAG: BsuPI-related putative proteinase inhibitor [Clostridia bacterium]|nr:BsuPI-related putative proteinase inhibitor [Clostridia bacterium]